MPIHSSILNRDISYLVKPTPESMVNAIRYLKNNPEILRNIALKGKRILDKNYNFNILKKNYSDLLNNVL